MGSSLSTSRASAAAETGPFDATVLATNQTLHGSTLDVSKPTSKDLRAPAAGTVAKAWPRQLLPGPAPSPLSSFATKLAEALRPLANGDPIDLDRVAQHVRPDLGTAAPPANNFEPMPGPAGNGINHLRHYVVKP